MKYEVLRDCYGYKGKYWTKGELVSFSDDDTPPHHFRLLEEEQKTNEKADPISEPSTQPKKPKRSK